MNVIVTITDNGKPREAIPVRAIPWVTSFKAPQDVVVRDLSRRYGMAPKLENATAYYLIEKDKARAMAPREWDAIDCDLSALEEDLKAMDLFNCDDRHQWELRATQILPAGAFLWRDEFELAYQSGYGSPTWTIADEREGEREYTFHPIVPECFEAIILEGFAQHATAQEGEPHTASRETCEMSVGKHPGYGPWEAPRLPHDVHRLPLDYWSRDPKIGPIPEWYERPRQCSIEEDDAISFSQARELLEPKWNTTPAEIALWILEKHPGLHIFQGDHEIWEDWINHRFSFLRCAPDLADSTRPCSNLADRIFTLVDRESFANSFVDSLVNYKFSRHEVERFDPANNEWDSAAPIEYIADQNRNRFNPSGRLLTYAKAVEFLSGYSYAPEDAAAAINREYMRGGVIGLAPLGLVTQNMPGFVDLGQAPMAETWFLEGQIVGLAKAEFGAPVTRWDAASRPDATEEVALMASDAPALSGYTGATEPAEAPRPTVAPGPAEADTTNMVEGRAWNAALLAHGRLREPDPATQGGGEVSGVSFDWKTCERPYYVFSQIVRFWCEIPSERGFKRDPKTTLPISHPSYPLVAGRAGLLRDAINTGQLRSMERRMGPQRTDRL